MAEQKPDVEYPTPWGYKIIGEDLEELYEVAEEVMGDKKYSHKTGGRSKTGKYITLILDTVVHSEEERDALFEAFSSHTSVKVAI